MCEATGHAAALGVTCTCNQHPTHPPTSSLAWLMDSSKRSASTCTAQRAQQGSHSWAQPPKGAEGAGAPSLIVLGLI